MAEEEDDQDSSFDEPHAEEPIKVSVTFKSRNQEAEVKLLDNSESSHSVHRDESPSGNPSKLNASCHDRETKDTRLAVNQHEPSIPSHMIETGKDKKRVREEDALKGWQGYSNNIYIKPITVNNMSRDTRPYSSSGKPQRKLTTEDLRKQIGLREANSWVENYNETLRSTGSLRKNNQVCKEEKHEATAKFPKQTKEEQGTDQSKRTTKIKKGFACRTWAASFLSKSSGEKKSGELVCMFVRQYAENLNSSAFISDKGSSSTKKGMEGRAAQGTDSDRVHGQNTSTKITKLVIDLKGKTSFDQNKETGEPKFKNGTKSIHGCFCGKKVMRDDIMRRSQSTASISRLRFNRSKSMVALPVKQFPPINPLQAFKKPYVPVRETRSVLLTRRPHTVDTACLAKELMLVNGHYNLPDYVIENHYINGCCVQRIPWKSMETVNKGKQVVPWADFKHGKSLDDVMDISSPRKKEDRDGTIFGGTFYKQEITKRKERTIQERNVAVRKSKSDLYRNKESSRRRICENKDVFRISKANRQLASRTSTPPHSTSDENNDSDSNDTGLGTDIEYTVDGSAKIDVYLQPRGNSCH
ncbi:uncharacterized protein [Montipora foliosa]|uniref:uncharacterized protein n=1 Tax=Montipora foliosa TaxID=591990 RepID=UPI0035F0FD6F